MKRSRVSIAAALVAAAVVCPAQAGLVKPWDDLTASPDANWIAPAAVNIYSANTAAVYPTSFKTTSVGGSAKGMNALTFVDGSDARHKTPARTGTVEVLGGNDTFTDLVVLIAVEADELPAGFGLTLNGYTCDPAEDFVYYDGSAYAAGRPSGYYPPNTSPTGEPIAYDFEAGMVTVLSFSNITLDPTHNYELNYAFENLTERAVFSVYGLRSGSTSIYHTNRGLYDSNLATSAVSTFEVLPEPTSLLLLAAGAAATLRRRRT